MTFEQETWFDEIKDIKCPNYPDEGCLEVEEWEEKE